MRIVWVLAALSLVGCGSSYIVLEVEADLEIPVETDSLHVVAYDADEIEIALLNIVPPLKAGMAFPLDVLLEPSADTPRRLLVFRVRALLEDREVAVGETRSKWAGDDLSLGVELTPSP